jgi:hypothetical protein
MEVDQSFNRVNTGQNVLHISLFIYDVFFPWYTSKFSGLKFWNTMGVLEWKGLAPVILVLWTKLRVTRANAVQYPVR